MAKRSLTIVEHGLYKFAVCAKCNAQFKSSLRYQDAAEKEIRQQFDAHRCKRLDESPNAARIVREAAKGK
jgi:hypothetical protein